MKYEYVFDRNGYMTLYFQSSNGKRRKLGEYTNKEDILKAINKFLDDHSFKSYYTRIWREEDEVWIDVGSWSEFFIVKDEDREWGEIS